jgi:hypothetical protein
MSAIMTAAAPASELKEVHVPKRFEGTYKTVDTIDWLSLTAANFNTPDWARLYPLNNKGQPTGMLSPRMACKLFSDACFILEKAAANEKYLQDRIPEATHKFYKKKQWRKQFLEGARRVACRLAKGLGFSPNCPAEECFVHVIMRDTFELGWRRIQLIIETLPETDKDRDFARVTRLACNEDIGYLYKMGDSADGSKDKKAVDFKAWFKANDHNKMNDHEL